ncbi:MAG: tetratricopeptide repeat protein [Nitrospinae bacterium]|nr:tetratricopeptide repeat protein [Nitrospinota bacterium]
MSIVTDALNRLQSERSRPASGQEGGPSTPGIPIPEPPIDVKPDPFSAGSALMRARAGIRTIGIVFVLAVIGAGTYFWGMAMGPDMPPVKVVGSSPAPPVPDRAIAPVEVPAEGPLEPGSDTSLSLPEAGDALLKELDQPEEAAGPETGPQVASLVPPLDQDLSEPEPTTQKAEETTSESTPSKDQVTPSQASAQSASPEKQAESGTAVNKTPALPQTAPASPSNKGSEEGSEKESDSSRIPEAPSTVSVEPAEFEPESNTGEEETPQETMVKETPIVPQKAALSFDERLARAQQLIKKRRYSQALTVLQPAFKKPPERWEAWFWMGTAQLGLGHLDEAEHSFMEGLARDATIPYLWVQRALVGQQRGQFGEAIEALRQAELLAPELPEVQLNLAFTLETRGNKKSAIEHYHTFLALTEGRPGYRTARKKVLDRVIRLKKT